VLNNAEANMGEYVSKQFKLKIETKKIDNDELSHLLKDISDEEWIWVEHDINYPTKNAKNNVTETETKRISN
jgi:hypothetical protein